MSDTAFAPNHLPRVCGFNLTEKFHATDEHPRGQRFAEWDFDFLAEHGFTFARLPMDYTCWTRDLDGARMDVDETVLEEIREAVEMGIARGIHVCVNFHRAPGYCINHRVDEPLNLWTDAPAREAFVHHWSIFAAFFAEYSNEQVSFDLVNEPPGRGQRGFTAEAHRQVMGEAVAAIRSVTADRLIICDGHGGGHYVSDELIDLGVAQSCRGYIPFEVTHHKASWCTPPGADGTWPPPAWPMQVTTGREDRHGLWDRAALAERVYQDWRELEAKGVGVHCGEFGVFKETPAATAYAFLDDVLSLFDEYGWGWGLWNLRGSFGVLDSGREGVAYEDCDGHALDRTMLELLKRHRP